MQTGKIDALLLEVQKELESVICDKKNPHFKNNYATFNAVIDTVKKPLNDNGILIEQIPDCDEFGRHVKTVLLHVASGEEKSCKVYLELPKPDMQKVGSAITYAKRYGLQTLCVLPSEDDDGNDAAGVQKTSAQATIPTHGFGGKVSPKLAKKVDKVVKKTVTEAVKETPVIPVKTRGFSSKNTQIATKTVTVQDNKEVFTNSNNVTPPPQFNNKPTFSSRGVKAEPEF